MYRPRPRYDLDWTQYVLAIGISFDPLDLAIGIGPLVFGCEFSDTCPAEKKRQQGIGEYAASHPPLPMDNDPDGDFLR